MSPAPIRHVFVYGTLRRGEERDINRLLPAPRRVGPASVRGILVQLGTYPGVVLGGPARVHGEVYEISAELEGQLDAIEGVWPQPSGEYLKREMAVRLERAADRQGLEEVICLLYELAPGRAFGKPVIAGGDWVRHRTDSASPEVL